MNVAICDSEYQNITLKHYLSFHQFIYLQSFTSSVHNEIALARPFLDLSDDDLRAYLQTLGDNCTDGIVGKGLKVCKLNSGKF